MVELVENAPQSKKYILELLAPYNLDDEMTIAILSNLDKEENRLKMIEHLKTHKEESAEDLVICTLYLDNGLPLD